MTQQPLILLAVHDAAQKLTGAFLSALHDGGWHKGRELCALLGTDERTIRKIADQSRGSVISSDRGYKLTAFATVEEVDHAERRLLSQARKMTERATEIRRCRNQGGRAA